MGALSNKRSAWRRKADGSQESNRQIVETRRIRNSTVCFSMIRFFTLWRAGRQQEKVQFQSRFTLVWFRYRMRQEASDRLKRSVMKYLVTGSEGPVLLRLFSGYYEETQRET
jgi:hypothetical protein